MSANPPILTIPRQRLEPEEHIHRYLDSIHQHQPEHIIEGHKQFRKEQENGFSEVASCWARGDSSSQGKFSEEVMGRRGRAGSSPPRMGPSRGVEGHTREPRAYASVPVPIEPPVRRGMGVKKAAEERFEGNLEIAEREFAHQVWTSEGEIELISKQAGSNVLLADERKLLFAVPTRLLLPHHSRPSSNGSPRIKEGQNGPDLSPKRCCLRGGEGARQMVWTRSGTLKRVTWR
jgi:hypothetical protein